MEINAFQFPDISPVLVEFEADPKTECVVVVGEIGGSDEEDAAEFVLAGASAVEMGTAIYADPRSAERVVKGLCRWVASQGVSSIGDLVGKVELSSGDNRG